MKQFRSPVTSALWSLRFGILAFVLIAFGWLISNIWGVIAGTVLAFLSVHSVVSAKVSLLARIITGGAIFGILVALALRHPANHDLALSAGIYALILLSRPWAIYKPLN
jgi:hypothetical protein